MENPDPYLEKFSKSGRRIFEGALDETRRREQYYVSPEHILYALMTKETDLFDATMHNLSLDPQEIRLTVEKRLENSRRHTSKGFRIAPETTEISNTRWIKRVQKVVELSKQATYALFLPSTNLIC